MSGPSLGSLGVSLPKLLDSRLLVQAQSGGGKSHLLRRLVEQLVQGVQVILIDPEGEFSSLREKFDLILCGANGPDAVANPTTAAALARAIWSSGASAIVDVYDLKAHERILFVRRFLEALINAPKAMWHPTLVVIDEVHIFAPQVGQAESLGAVIDLATRGRKRGLALVAATQRLSKLHKDVAAELQNKLIGRTGLDVDIARAGDELGMSKKEAWAALSSLRPGEFYAYGPALSESVISTTIGPVQTSHPKAGGRTLKAPSPPSKALMATLAKLEGIQRGEEQDEQDVKSLRARVRDLERNLVTAKKEGGIPEAEVQRRCQAAADGAHAAVMGIIETAVAEVSRLGKAGHVAPRKAPAAAQVAPRPQPAPQRPLSDPAPAPGAVEGLRAGAVRILQELAARAPAGYSRPQVGTLTQFSHKGGTFTTYLGDLRRGGFIEERGGLVYASEHGITSLGGDVPKAPKSHYEVMTLWRRALRSGAFSILETIVNAGPGGVHRDGIAETIGMTASGGTFTTYLGDLRRNGLITEQDKVCTANDILFPDRVR